MPQHPMASSEKNEIKRGQLIASAPTRDSELHAP